MRVLLDTHAFLWFICGDERLSICARSCIEDEGTTKLVSIASIWEIAIKTSIGRLAMVGSFDSVIPAQIARNGFSVLDIRLEHIARVVSLPLHHRDPFDRLLISQALVEDIPIVTRDAAFHAYDLECVW